VITNDHELMKILQKILEQQYDAGRVPGAVALVARDGQTEVATVGEQSIGGPPMTRDSLFRIASITKPIVAAATMVLVERGVLGLDDPVDDLLPELADPVVLGQANGPLDDVVPAERSITVRDLLTLRGGHGFTADVESPVARALQERLRQGRPRPLLVPPAQEWMVRLGEIPLVHQPGAGWTYNVGSDVLGVLLARAAGKSLGEVLRETVFEPVGMSDTGFWSDDAERMTSLYQRGNDGFELIDPPDGQWASPPPFESGAGGLVSTVDDWFAFGQMLLREGTLRGRQVLSPASARLMMTSHVEADPDNPFLDGQGWGFGGGVDVLLKDPWNVIGRYGWIGGTGTAAYVIPSTGTVVVWLGQVELTGPDDMTAMAEVLTYAARVG
jgi:CubicO group peptidase (beta-lactamase class C family)